MRSSFCTESTTTTTTTTTVLLLLLSDELCFLVIICECSECVPVITIDKAKACQRFMLLIHTPHVYYVNRFEEAGRRRLKKWSALQLRTDIK